MAKTKETTEGSVTCPDCGGEGTKPAPRYTDPTIICPTCSGARVVTDQVAQEFATANAPAEETAEPAPETEPAAAEVAPDPVAPETAEPATE